MLNNEIIDLSEVADKYDVGKYDYIVGLSVSIKNPTAEVTIVGEESLWGSMILTMTDKLSDSTRRWVELVAAFRSNKDEGMVSLGATQDEISRVKAVFK